MTVAAALFAVAALGGIALAAIRLRGQEWPPMALALIHGALAASGLAALLVAVLRLSVPNLAWASLGLFMLAALGGFACSRSISAPGAARAPGARPRPDRGRRVRSAPGRPSGPRLRR